YPALTQRYPNLHGRSTDCKNKAGKNITKNYVCFVTSLQKRKYLKYIFKRQNLDILRSLTVERGGTTRRIS
ncbi:unnamed protein product, partial [Acanthoscelides obtectus]